MSKLIVSLYVIATSLALIVLKMGSKDGAPVQLSEGRLQFNITTYTILGVLFYGVSFILYMYLISKYDLGYIVPLTTAFVYIVIFSASFFIFKEAFTVMKIIGITLIVLGLIFLNLKK